MRILIVDDDPLVCSSLATILGAQGDIEVVGLGQSGDDAIRLYQEKQPDVLLMDIQMPGRNGLDAAFEIRGQTPEARIVFLTTFADDDYIVAALRMGVCGYLIKQDVAKIAPALRSVMAGQSVLGNEVLDRLDALVQPPQALRKPVASGREPASAARAREGQGAHSPLASLSERERDIVELIAEGLDNREIAARVHISEGTVRNHISMILTKLNMRNRTQLAILYYQASMR